MELRYSSNVTLTMSYLELYLSIQDAILSVHQKITKKKTKQKSPVNVLRHMEILQVPLTFKVDWVLDGHALCCKLGYRMTGDATLWQTPKYRMLQQVFSTCIYQPCFTITSCHDNYQHTWLCHGPRGCWKYIKSIWIEALYREIYI